MHEVWSSPLFEWIKRVVLAYFGVGLVRNVSAWPPDESWVWCGVGLWFLWLAWPRAIDRPLLQRPMLLAGLGADGIRSEWPVRRLIPYDMVRGVTAWSGRSFTHATITLDPEAPRARRHRKIKLHWTSDAPAALFIVTLERRTGVHTETRGWWFGREVEKQREKVASWARRRAGA